MFFKKKKSQQHETATPRQHATVAQQHYNAVAVGQHDALPVHIAIIMDGNGRWAAGRSLARTAGHAAGAETFRRIATYCKDIGIEYLTTYAFSTENWKRSADEISSIMGLLEKYLHESLEKMERDKVKMKFLGDTTVLSPKLQDLIAKTEELSEKFDGVQVNICLNYGARAEILQAIERYTAEQIKKSSAEQPKLTEEIFAKYLYTADIPDPDLIIRPSGEMRLSNFLLWQSAYSEFYYTDTLWPDFDEKELDRAIMTYRARDRRYGRESGKEKMLL
ncbi:MAG: di-trans,poly-cis-decaprenylcistransferase [Oscillospiraceae bacterium]|jgi:undecaprenyl diphosphate synthase|nr:di-trans,poly-cis-decaprenylcistransferase [Oscillospiraceae bacterium]